MKCCKHCGAEEMSWTGILGRYVCHRCGKIFDLLASEMEEKIDEKVKTMDEQTTNANWLDAEIEENKNAETEKVEWLKFEENKINEFEIDFSKKFEKRESDYKGTKRMQAIIPVVHDGQKKPWGLNVKNPIYGLLLAAGKKGVTHFKVMQTGKGLETRYILVQ